MPDVWVWAGFGVVLALLGARALVVETGYATLGRTPVMVKVLTGACALAVVGLVGLVMVDGGAELVSLLLDPAKAAAQKAGESAADASTAPPPAPATVEPTPAVPAPPPPTGPPSAAPTMPPSAP